MESSQLTDIFSSYERPTDLTEIDLNEDYKNRVINTDNVKDKIEGNNDDKASETHQRIVKELGEIFSKIGYQY